MVERLAEVGNDVVCRLNTDADAEDPTTLRHWIDQRVDLAEAHGNCAHLEVVGKGAHCAKIVTVRATWLEGEHTTPVALEKFVCNGAVWV